MELFFTFILLIVAKTIWPTKKQSRQDRGDNYIILSELEQNYGNESSGHSIYDGDGDSDF